MTLILGSKSPRRKEILSFFSIPFIQKGSNFDEESVSFNGDPFDYVRKIARGKGEALSLQYPSETILTADTAVFCEEKVFGKPSSNEEAVETLLFLQGKWHQVITALILYSEGQFSAIEEKTNVLFNSISQSQAELYVQSLHTADKAGAYLIQRAGALIVNQINGCFYNVMGLPMNALRSILSTTQIDLWHNLKEE